MGYTILCAFFFYYVVSDKIPHVLPYQTYLRHEGKLNREYNDNIITIRYSNR